MDIGGMTQLLGGINNQQNNNNQAQQAPAIPGAPAQQTGNNVGTDFGAAALFEPTPVSDTIQQQTPQSVQQMWNHHQQQVDSFRRMIETLINQQAERQGLAFGNFMPNEIEVTPEMRAEAAEMVEEGGYFSVEETAARIIGFAVALSGGDERHIATLERGMERGFAMAERMWGDQLPEISQQTHEAVREAFEQWRTGGVDAIALLNR